MFDEVLKEWKRNVAVIKSGKRKGKPDTLHPVYKPLCTYVRKYVRGKLRSNYDLHYVMPSLSDGSTADVAFYVLKYMMKPSNRAIRLQQALHMNLSEDEYEDVWSLVRPRHFESDCLGLGVSDLDSLDKRRAYYKIVEYLRKGLELSKSRSPDSLQPLFFSPVNGKSAPLAKYYKSNPLIYDMQDFLDFFYGSSSDDDNIIIHERDHFSQQVKKIDDFADKVDDVSFKQSAYELDDLFDSEDEDFIGL